METEHISLPYPQGLAKIVLQLPIPLYRLGFGGLLNNLFLLILTTRGHTSGEPRHTAVEYRRHGSKIYLISAWGEQSQWYQNLLIDPLATLQLGRKTYSALADPVTDPAEITRVITLFRRKTSSAIYRLLVKYIPLPTTAAMQANGDDFRILRMNIIQDEPTLPTLQADWKRWWPILGMAIVVLLILLVATRSRRKTPVT
jgi:deazaflavin-dependent oxidoreductase (nitroreductase family)